jgi:hypothetical protein
VQVLFDRLKNRVRVQLDIPHHLGEHVPFDLGERQKDVLICEQRVLATTRLLEGAIDDALRRFSYLAWRNIEVLYVHVFPPANLVSKTCASRQEALGAGISRRKRL